MIKKILILTLAAALGVLAFEASAAEQQINENPGYSVKLTATTVDLVFPDGSVLSAPLDFDGKSLEGITATEGMAGELLDQAYEQMGARKPVNLPRAFAMSQNFPNPFNPSTVISYTIPEQSEQIAVKLNVFNIRGQLLRTLVDEIQGPGIFTVEWDGVDNTGRKVASGVYFYRITAGNFVSMRKMVMLK
jgi:hypothetical protein